MENLSSLRFKEEIQDIGLDSDAILKLRTVVFKYKGDESETRRYGLIAEEVEQILPDLVSKDSEGNPQSVIYYELLPLLINEFQKQHKLIQEQKKLISSLTERIESLEERLRDLQPV